MIAARYGRVRLLVVRGVVALVVGYLGLLLVPTMATWLWVALAGIGPLLFPLALVLINLRTRTHSGAVAISAFVQSAGYLIVAIGPLARRAPAEHDRRMGLAARLLCWRRRCPRRSPARWSRVRATSRTSERPLSAARERTP